jgi:hypothetical protein
VDADLQDIPIIGKLVNARKPVDADLQDLPIIGLTIITLFIERPVLVGFGAQLVVA